MRSVLATVAVLALAAGCVAPAPAAETLAASAAAGPLARDLGAVPGIDPAPGAWWLLESEAGPATPLAAFAWTVPEGAVVPSAWFDDEDTVVLEVAPVLADDAPEPAQWALLAFVDDGRDSELVASVVETPASVAFRFGLQGEEEDILPEFDPMHVWLGISELKPGDRLTFVLAATADEPAPFAVAFRVLPEDPGHRTDPARSSEAFLAARGEAPLLAPAPVASGEGFQAAFHLDFDWLLWSFEVTTPAVVRTVDEVAHVDPVARVGDVRLTTGFESDAGTTYAFGGHFAEVEAAEWAVAARAHGESAEGAGRSVGTPVVAAAWFVLPPPFFALVAEGEGGSSTELAVHRVGAGHEATLLFQLDLGATVESLAGDPVDSESWISEGLLGAALHAGDGAWLLRAGGAVHHLGGLPAAR